MEFACCDQELNEGEAALTLWTHGIEGALRERIEVVQQLESADPWPRQQAEDGRVKIGVADVAEHERKGAEDPILGVAMTALAEML
jgi:hypothetical protein